VICIGCCDNAWFLERGFFEKKNVAKVLMGKTNPIEDDIGRLGNKYVVLWVRIEL
jgi:hypothetical protein